MMGQRRNVLTPERSPARRWGRELRNRRDQAGLSLAKLGLVAAFDPSYLARLERGDQFASEDAARACDAALAAGGELIRQWRQADRERRQAATAPAAMTRVAAVVVAVELPPFNEHAVCSKCAGAAVGTAYHAAPVGRCPCASAAGEHLCRACQRCGYAWCEATADAAPACPPALRLVAGRDQRAGR